MELYLHSPIRLHGVVPKYRDNFTFIQQICYYKAEEYMYIIHTFIYLWPK